MTVIISKNMIVMICKIRMKFHYNFEVLEILNHVVAWEILVILKCHYLKIIIILADII